MSETALAPVQPLEPKPESKLDADARRLTGIHKRRAIREAQKVIEQGAIDATRIDDDGTGLEPREGEAKWTRDRMRVAQDMRKSKRNAPVYLDHAHRRLEAYEAQNKPPPQMVALNIGTINLVQPPEYPVIDVTGDKR